METYENVTAALADPDSNIARFTRDAQAVTTDRLRLFADWQAEGMTVEECWTRYLAVQHELVYG